MPRLSRKKLNTSYFHLIVQGINYEILKGMNFNEIILNKDKLKETINELVIEQKIPINKVSDLLGISRFKISRIINKK